MGEHKNELRREARLLASGSERSSKKDSECKAMVVVAFSGGEPRLKPSCDWCGASHKMKRGKRGECGEWSLHDDKNRFAGTLKQGVSIQIVVQRTGATLNTFLPSAFSIFVISSVIAKSI
jgi:hypothetical protein